MDPARTLGLWKSSFGAVKIEEDAEQPRWVLGSEVLVVGIVLAGVGGLLCGFGGGVRLGG